MNEASLSFKNIILKNLSNNGFPMKRVSLPLEKLYEAADKKGANLNQILENLSTEGTMHEKSEDKIIFHAQMPQNMDSDDMMKQAQEMMGQMTFGNFQDAQLTHHALAPLLRILESEGEASGIKAILNHFNWADNLVRLPNTPVSEEIRTAIYRELAELPQHMVELAMQ